MPDKVKTVEEYRKTILNCDDCGATNAAFRRYLPGTPVLCSACALKRMIKVY